MRYVIRLLVGCAFGLWAAAPAVQAGPREDCEQAKDRDLKIRACNEIIRGDKRAAWAYIDRGDAYRDETVHFRSLNDFEQAVADYSEAIRLDPKNARAYRSRGAAYLRMGDYDRAIPDLNDAIKLDPRDALAYLGRGGLYSNTGDDDRAIADYSEAIRLNPSDAKGYGFRGGAYFRKGDYDRAIADYGEAIRLDPFYITYRGHAYSKKGDYDRAIADYNEVIRRVPNSDSYSNRGRAYFDKGDHDRAIADYSKVIRDSPTIAFPYSDRGKAYQAKGDHDRAIADYTEAIRLASEYLGRYPTYAHYYSFRGLVYEAKGDRDRAIEDYNKVLELPAVTRHERDEQAQTRRRLAALRGVPPAAAPPAVATQPLVTAAPVAVAPQMPSTPLGRRVALVIGNAGYKVGPLRNPGNDAAAVAEALGKLGFDKVILKRDLGLDGFRVALREFARESAGAGLGLVYFAGHGTEVAGRNFLIPVDAALASAGDLDLEAIALDTVLKQLGAVRTLKLVILDACRNNVFPLAGPSAA